MDLPMSMFAQTEVQNAGPGPEGPKSEPALTEVSPSHEEGQLAAIYDKVRFGMIRIQSIVTPVRWSRPYEQEQEQMGVGSGFAVEMEGLDSSRGPVFITNAHVVEDSRSVQVQLPAFSQVFFDAYVPLICKEFDLAVVQLVEPRKLVDELERANTTLQPLRIEYTPPKMGMEVAAVGFPLGTTSLKLSRGIISGTEEVDGAICYQTTAPISPGNSGGPLLALGGLNVVGANFATSAKGTAQNVNYVVPLLHIRKVLFEFHRIATSPKPPLLPQLAIANSTAKPAVSLLATKRKNASSEILKMATSSLRGTATMQANQTLETNATSAQGRHSTNAIKVSDLGLYHTVLKIAPLGVSTVEANDALYDSHGCTRGVFLSHMEGSSVLKHAQPPVPPRSFVVSVANISVDSTGAGRADEFLGDPTPFQSLFTLWQDIDDPVVLTSCFKGKETQHKVPMRWQPRYQQGIEYVREPHILQDVLDFETFAGVLVMRMTLDHISNFLTEGSSATLGRWLLPEYRSRSRLVITDVSLGTYASRVLSAGMVVEKVNGKGVSTLADFRKHFVPNGTIWELETDRGIIFAVNFKKELQNQIAEGSATEHNSYLLTKGVRVAAEHILPDSLPVSHEENAKNSDHVAHEVQELASVALATAGQAVATAAQAAEGILAPHKGEPVSKNVTSLAAVSSNKTSDMDNSHIALEVGQLAAAASATAKQAADALDKIAQFRKKLGATQP